MPELETFRPSTGGLLRLRFVTAGVLVWLVAGASCAPEPRSARCRNDSQCPDSEYGRAFCVRSRCVECVTHASCGEHRSCRAGACVEDSG